MPDSSPNKHPGGVINVVPETDEIVAVCLEGEFDMANAPMVSEEINRTLEEGKDVIVDLSETTFIDSSLISVLMHAAAEADQRERAIVLQHHTAAEVKRVIEITGIEHVLPRAHDRSEAVRMVQERRGTA